ncbi:sulfite exporter TauE/SafE family protein [Pontibacterium granulatum]|uniref:sulfite exporter TauE/SafE family protein n=1 Tax=Pontibacterium granulatum TaxID=2036029 RepID=UPI00249C5095|nr:sulfite exporter TauE/SafE family protein [Pontibacterium granulatum]MDI3322795.1 sulfite exporter TauE/SafE family protein [Pontibacterium granulatum]
MIDIPLFYLFAIPAVMITGISKGGFGGGLGLLAVPMMSFVISPVQAAAIMLPILCLMDIFGVIRFRKFADWSHLSILLPAALLGILLGTFSFHYLDEAQIKLMIGTVAMAFVVNHLRGKGQDEAKPRSVWRGSFWGVIGGFTSFGVHAGGAPLNIYLLPLKLDKAAFVGTTVIFFTTVNYIKLVPYFWLGQFTTDTLLTALVLAPLAPLGVYIGSFLHHRIDERWFYKFCYGLLALAGTKLLIDGISGLI